MLGQHDSEAMIKFAIRSGCEAIKADVHGVVTDYDASRASTCFRRQGDPDCLWFPSPILEKDEP